MCGKGRENGIKLYTDHIKTKNSGGKSIIENGQTLCTFHNLRKKNLNYTESGREMFIHLYEQAKSTETDEMAQFYHHILEVFEEHGVNDCIEWGK